MRASFMQTAGGLLAVCLISGMLNTQSSRAATLSFDYSSGTPAPIANVVGTSGTMNFQLDLNDPFLSNVFGNFSMDIYDPSNNLLGTISLAGGPLISGITSQDFGDISTGVTDSLPDIASWSLFVTGGDLPSSLVVTSTLDSIGDPANPVLTMELTGDLSMAVASIPLPGTLSLFVPGLATIGLMMRRRQRRGPAVISADSIE